MRSLLTAGLAAALVTAMGCADVASYRPSRTEPMAALTDEESGVCVSAGPVRSCLSTNRTGNPPDSFVATTVTSQNPQEANPEYWRIAVIRDDGETLIEQALTVRGVALQPICPYGVCMIIVKALERVPPWRPGGYTVRYTYVPSQRRVDLIVRLR